MNDLISRQAAIDALKEHRSIFCDSTPETFSVLPYGEKCRVDEIDNAIATLVNLPSAQPERKTGRWIEFPSHNAYKCSECGRVIETTDGQSNVYKHYPYCHCGCRMEAEQ